MPHDSAEDNQPLLQGNGYTYSSYANGEYVDSPVKTDQEAAPTADNTRKSITELYAPSTAGIIPSAVNLTNTIIGAGMLGLPYAFAKVGIVLGTIMLIACGLASSFGLYLLSRASMRSGPKSSYFAVANLTYPKASFLIDFSIAITCFGSAVAYLIVIGELMPLAMATFLGLPEEPDQNSAELAFYLARWFWITVYTAILLPLVFAEKLESIKIFSYIGLVSIAFMLYVLVYYIADGSFPAEIRKEEPDIVLFKLDFEFFKALPILVFGFTCHMNIFTICNELKDYTPKRIGYVINGSVGFSFLIYQFIATLGYLTFGSSVGANIIRGKDGEGSYPESDIFVAIARVAICLHVSLSFCLQAHPCRHSVEKLVAGGHIYSDRVHRIRYFVLTVLIVASAYVIAFFVSNLDTVFGLVGAVGSTMMAYILPGVFYYKLKEKDRWSLPKVSGLIMTLFGVIIAPLCVIFLFVEVH